MLVYVLTTGIDGEPDYDIRGVYASESFAEAAARNELRTLGVDNPKCHEIQGGKIVNCDGIMRFTIYEFGVADG